MRTPSHHLAAALVLLCLFAAPPRATTQETSTGEGFDVAGTYPLPNEALQDRLIIYFNAPISVEDGEAPLRFEPELAGTVEVGPTYLSFRRDTTQRLPRQGYLVTVTPAVRAADGRTRDDAARELRFSTYTMGLEDFQYVTRDEDHTIMRLALSAPMTREALVEALRIRDGEGQHVLWNLVGDSPANSYRLQLPRVLPAEMQVHLAEGALDASGHVAVGPEETLDYPAGDSITVQDTEWRRLPNGRHRIELVFNAAVQQSAVHEFLQLRREDGEAQRFRVETRGMEQRAVLFLQAPIPESGPLMLRVDAGLPGAGRRVLGEAFETELRVMEQPLQINYIDWRTEGVEGPSLFLRFNRALSLESLEEHLSISPEVPDLRISREGESQVYLQGAFRSGERYTLSLAPELVHGPETAAERTPYVMVVDEAPEAAAAELAHPGKFYFPRRAAGPMPVRARNLEEVQVRVHELLPSNIVQAIEYLEDGQTWDIFGERYAREIAAETLVVAGPRDEVVTVPLDVQAMLPEGKKGVFGLSVDPSSNWRNTKIVVWTDIGLLTHWQNDELVVFAHDLFSLEPLPRARVTVYSHKNQVLGTANTDARGVAHLNAFDSSLGNPRVLVVETDTDYTFLDLQERHDDPVGFTEQMPRFDSGAYDAFIYGDRSLYRPGETAHLRWVVRTGAGDAVDGMPLQVRVLNPQGVEVHDGPTRLSEIGTGGMTLETQPAYLTGRYTLELRVPGEDMPIETHTFSLEEFVPNRLRADVEVAETIWLPNQEQALTVKAEHLFGAPAANRRAEANVILRRGNFAHPDWQGFRFTNEDSFQTEVVPLGEAQTDAAGEASFSYTYEPSARVTFPLAATVVGQVSELGGRAVRNTQDVTILPAETLLGLAVTQESGNAIEINVAAIQADGAPAGLETARVVVEREVWSYHVRRYDSYNEPQWTKSFERLEARDVELSEGRGRTTFALPGRYGYYRVRVQSNATPQYASQSFYAYYNRIDLVEAARPSLIKLSLNQARYQIGEEVELRIESPFDGRGIVVVQGEQIQQVLTTTIQDGVGSVRFIANHETYPNVWLEATVVHEVDTERTQVYPYSSFAMINAPVEDPARQIQVAFPDMPEEVRPAQDVAVRLSTHDPRGNPISAEVTVALVDEGIHQILGYETPDPAAWFQRTRQPDYRRAHYYDHVAYDFEAPPIGGDLIARRLGRSTDIDENWIRPLALWSGVVHTDEDGEATLSFTLPEFSGQVRLVAVAVTEEAAGSEDAYLRVRRPFMLQTSYPRFTLPGDRFQVRSVLYNTTDQDATARVAWQASGTLSGTGSQEVPLPAGQEASFPVDFRAGSAVGQGEIGWTVEVLNARGELIETLVETAPLPVRVPAVYQSDHQAVVLLPGESRLFENTLFRTDSQIDTHITASANPMLRLQKALQYVVGYPYGCLEQTISRVMPVYLLRQHAGLVDASLEDAMLYEQYLRAAIERAFTMQIPSGALAMWPGGVEPYPYGSVYALHFLTLVKSDRELNVPENSFRALQDYVRGMADDSSDDSPSGLYRRAYAYYVLALDGDLESLEQIERFDRLAVPRAARYLLAAALALNTQDPARVQAYLDTTPSEPFNARETAGTLNSEIRNTAVEVLAQVQMNIFDAAFQDKVQQLLRYLDGDGVWNTQDTAFVVTALGAYLDTLGEVSETAKATIDSPNGPLEISGGELFEARHSQEAAYTVSNTGNAPVFVNFTIAGIPAQASTAPVEEGIKLRRVYRDEANQTQEGEQFTHGYSYLAHLTLELSETMDNVIVADLLPAGLEIENPRLDADVLAGYKIDGAATPAYLEIRDDRLVVAFDRLARGTHHFYYLVRAVTPGQFQQPPVHAECMYLPSLHGRSGAGQVEVVLP